MTIILVRHAMPAIDPAVPPEEWELGEDGHRAAALLRKRLPPGALLVASAEPKAWQTIGADIRDSRFNEVWRIGEPFDESFRIRRRSYVEGVDHEGWEPRADVVKRS